jgi:polygalacturonase
MRRFLVLPLLAVVSCAGAAPGRIFPARDFGAAGDGARRDTAAIQKAVDACAAAGGGEVRLGVGTYLSGTIILRSRVTLHLERGAVLLGSKDLADYPSRVPALRSYTDTYTEKSLIYAEKEEGVAVEGPGVIDGQGAAFKGPYKVRPFLMRFVECRDVAVRDVLLKDSPMWVQHYLGCEDVRIDRVRVQSRVNHNNDGIDIDGCRRVEVSGCRIVSGDDAICLKSTLDRPCRDVLVRDCEVSSLCNGLKLGTESNGGFANIRFRNCRVYDTRLAGLALEIVDGGTMDGIEVEDVEMENVGAAIFIRLGDRARPFKPGTEKPGVGKLRNVTIRRVRAVGAGKVGSSIAGLPGHPVEKIRLTDVSIASAGGGTADDAGRVPPEKPEVYPEFNIFGVLPSSGLYVRHAKEITLEKVTLRTASADARPAAVLSDVKDPLLKDVDTAGAAVRSDP